MNQVQSIQYLCTAIDYSPRLLDNSLDVLDTLGSQDVNATCSSAAAAKHSLVSAATSDFRIWSSSS